jgi:hypothetical protein
MLNDEGRLFDKEGRSFAITHNLKGNSIEEWERQFKNNEHYRLRKRSDSVYLTHEILSWHRDDAKNITPAKMEAMVRKYIIQRNPKGIYVAVPHFDRKHYHIHICASGIEYKTGKSLRLSKPDLLKLKKEIQQFQVEHFPELSKSIVEHGRKDIIRSTEKEYQLKIRIGRATIKENVLSIINSCFRKAYSEVNFLKLLNEFEVQTYDRSGQIIGVIYNNYKFRFDRLGFGNFKLIKTHEKRENELKNAKSRGMNRIIDR